MYKFLYKVDSSGQRIAVAKTPSTTGLPVQQEPHTRKKIESGNKAIESVKNLFI